jgi:UPF0716 protein FxsA
MAILVALFIVVPIVELYVIIQVGQWIGVVPTVLLLLADGVMIAVGGTLLLTPGFVTDIFGLLLLIPPSRAVVRRMLRGFFGRRFVVLGGLGGSGASGRSWPGGEAGPPRRDYDFEASAEEADAEDPRLPPS